MKTTRVSNAGVLLEIGGRKILIDGLCNAKSPFYVPTPAAIAAGLLSGEPPFDGVDLLLYTHHHADHFDTDSTEAFLERRKNLRVITTPETLALMGARAEKFSDRTHAPALPLHRSMGLKVMGLSIRVFSTRHDGSAHAATRNYAYLVEHHQSAALHLGDTGPDDQSLRMISSYRSEIDILLGNFPLVTLSGARKMIQTYFQIGRMEILHLPPWDNHNGESLRRYVQNVIRRGELPFPATMSEVPN